jgi:hypothetical protein
MEPSGAGDKAIIEMFGAGKSKGQPDVAGQLAMAQAMMAKSGNAGAAAKLQQAQGQFGGGAGGGAQGRGAPQGAPMGYGGMAMGSMGGMGGGGNDIESLFAQRKFCVGMM